MTKQASTEQLGNYLQLNQYKLMGMVSTSIHLMALPSDCELIDIILQVGQGSYSIVKLAYNVDEDTHYVSSQSGLVRRLDIHLSHIAGNENSL